jgi:hypothetical protein
MGKKRLEMEATTDSKLDGTKTIAHTAPRPRIVWLLTGLLLFLAFGALLGGSAFILAPDGHLIQMPLSHLNNSPFSSFLLPGILLFIFLGLYPLVIAYGLWKQPSWRWPNSLNPFKQTHWSWAGSLAASVIVLIWITVEVFWVPFGFVHIFYMAYGVLLVGITLLSKVRIYYSNRPK